jgi:hypothetical protein
MENVMRDARIRTTWPRKRYEPRRLSIIGRTRYKLWMRRQTRLGLITFAVLLAIAGAYTAYWYIVAGQIEESVVAWAQSARAEKIDLAWREIRVTGFPGAFRVELETATLRDDAVTPSPEVRTASISGTARPWDFADWQVTAPRGLAAKIAAAGERVPAKLSAQSAKGTVSIGPVGSWRVRLSLENPIVEAGPLIRMSTADLLIALPPKPAPEDKDARLVLAVNARDMKLPVAIGPLGGRIDEFGFAATIKGVMPAGKLNEALTAWRDAGGAIELDQLHLKWGTLGATASGTMALDQELQPSGVFSGAVSGYDQILTALVEGGQMRPTDAGLARIALGFLAKAGPDGKPEIKTAFAIRNGQMFLGPAKLGKAPRLSWE